MFGAYLRMVMVVLSPYHATSPGAAPPLSYLCGVAGILRGPTVSTSTISPSAATTKSTVARVLCFGGTTLSRRVWGWATVRRGRLPGYRASLPSQSVACAAHRLPTPSSTTAWCVPLFATSYPKVCRWMLSVDIFWCQIFSMRFSCVTLDLVAFPDALCPAWHRLL